MPSSNIESCARVRQTVPSVACGQINRPRSRRLANRHRPSPSHHKSLTMSPLRPRKTKTCPENGCCSSTVCTFALRPSNPRRISVTPAAIHIFVPVRRSITCANSQGSNDANSRSDAFTDSTGFLFGTGQTQFGNFGGRAELFELVNGFGLVWKPYIAGTIDQLFSFSSTLNIPTQAGLPSGDLVSVQPAQIGR